MKKKSKNTKSKAKKNFIRRKIVKHRIIKTSKKRSKRDPTKITSKVPQVVQIAQPLNFELSQSEKGKVQKKPEDIKFNDYKETSMFILIIEVALPILIGMGVVYSLWVIYENIFLVAIAIILIALAIILIEPLILKGKPRKSNIIEDMSKSNSDLLNDNDEVLKL